MEKSPVKERIELSLLVTPVLTLFGKKYSYRLLDSTYGEWLVYEKNIPKYYLNIFDTDYTSLKKITSDSNMHILDFLEKRISSLHPKLKMSDNYFGIKLNSQSFEENISLEKLSLSSLI